MTLRVTVLLAIGGCAEPTSSTAILNHDACNGVIVEDPLLESRHIDVGMPIVWPNNPPTSGPHWPVWAAWDRHYESIARAYWLHNAEHGGIVFGYRCDSGCTDIAEQLDTLVRALPDDPHCEAPLRHRAIVVADPLLEDDRTVFAVAWGTSYTASCVDTDALTGFYAANSGRATETTCADGGYTDGSPLY